MQYADPHVQLARLEHAPDEALGEVTPWVRERAPRLAALTLRQLIELAATSG